MFVHIEGIVGNDKIVELQRKHYQDLFNCVHNNLYTVGNMDFSEDVVVRAEEIGEAICKLDDNKSCGPDAMFAEHVKHASLRLIPLSAICMTGFLVHRSPSSL